MPETCPRCTAAVPELANYCARCGAFVSQLGPAQGLDPMIGRVALGRYRVLSLIAEGGMGRVYLAEQAMGHATRKVALKALRKELMSDPRVAARFLRESEIVIRLSHPNTIQFHDFGQLDDGTLVIVMEHIEGRTLAAELRGGPLPLPRVERLFAQICGSVAEAHALGVVHRDLKPHNVLLTERGGQSDFVKVLDFGIARQANEGDGEKAALTTSGMLVGTPPYMSPEQFTGQSVDARSDVYSLGVMLYELLTGALPFPARTPWQWAAAHTEQAPAPIESHASGAGLPERCSRAVMRALEKDPARRPADAAELLRELLGEQPTVVVPGGGAVPARSQRTSAVQAVETVPDDMAETLMAEPAASPVAPARPAARTPRMVWLASAGLLSLGALGWLQLRDTGADPLPATTDASGPAEPRARTAIRDSQARADELLGSLRAALAQGDAAAGLDAFAAARRVLGPRDARLRELADRLALRVSETVDEHSAAGRCEPIAKLVARATQLGVGDAPTLRHSLSACGKTQAFPRDGSVEPPAP